jgi:phage-related holin
VRSQIMNFLDNHLNEIKTALYSCFIFLNIDTDVVQILCYLMLIDTLSGIVKSVSLNVKFEFKVLFFGLCSKLLILLIPMVIALVGKGISKTYDFTPILDAVLKVLVVSEGLSVITNFYVVKTGKTVKNIDIVTLLLSQIRKWMQSFIESTIKKIDHDNN